MNTGAAERRDVLERFHFLSGMLIRAAVRAGSALLLLMCLLLLRPSVPQLALLGAAGLAAFGAVGRRSPAAWAVAAGLASMAATLVAAQPASEIPPNPSAVIEVPALLVLLVRMVRRAPAHRTPFLAVPPALALAVMPLRISAPAATVLSLPVSVLLLIATGIGLYLRALDARRARALVEARRQERLALARDLHDFVAHHVTGIVVQAQAARFTARSGAAQSPEQLEAMLESIERAGTEALASMRRMVGLLRDDGDGSPHGQARSARGLDRLAELVAAFTDPPASLVLDPRVRDLPPEVAATVHRIVQEALTNVRKHAADATAVHVSVRRFPEGVEVAVRDDGRGGERHLPGGGFGLVGLAERAEALGGRLRAGPGPGGGWEVVAFLPIA
ncbi:sensor histidine kinase [Thermomonospora sp. CIF 1]|uniref:sensor histidine kinase n=1 Tax=Thermomonospora sp. CIF 1 TaxID=1916083 RepID=UPI000A612116|nr:histidine kinase [Thermomonospora sp. CIF 1]PKK15170.1 MAG: two-component sensor histidine kinase [Thermomonospora sp. CIF 1]